jgi:hypothetical protein
VRKFCICHCNNLKIYFTIPFILKPFLTTKVLPLGEIEKGLVTCTKELFGKNVPKLPYFKQKKKELNLAYTRP